MIGGARRGRKWARGGGLALALVHACAAPGGLATDLPDEPAPSAQTQPPPAEEESPLARGGTRLEAMHYVAPGATQFRSLRDGLLGIDCAWAHGLNGSLRCLPLAQTPALIFLDEACTQPAALLERVSAPPVVAGDAVVPGALREGDLISVLQIERDADAERCGGSPRLQKRASYRVGEKISDAGRPPDPRPARYALVKGRCVGWQGPGGWVPSVHRVQPVDETAFVRGTLVGVDAGGGLMLQRVRGEDGSEATLGVIGARGETCRLIASGACVHGRTIATLATGHGGAPVFVDAECSERALRDPFAHVCDPPDFGIVERDGATRVITLRPTGSGYLKAGSACEWLVLPAGGPAELYEPGSDTTARFPAGRVARVGSGPLYRRVFAGAATDRIVPLGVGGRFEDEAGRACDVHRASDGTLRCYPARFAYDQSLRYADPACTDELVLAKPGVRDTAGLIIARDQTLYRPPVIDGLQALEVHEGPVYARSFEAPCAPAERPLGRTLLQRAGPIPLSALPEVTLSAR